MPGQDDDRCANYRRYLQLTEAYKAGDMAAVKAALGWPQDFPNGPQPMEFVCGDWPLVTAITLSPLRFIRQLLDLGADPNFPSDDGFPSLFCAIDADRPDRVDVLRLLLHYGAKTDQRGFNDWTPLHHAVARRNVEALKALLDHGADPAARTRIDDCATAREEAEAGGFKEAADLLRAAEN